MSRHAAGRTPFYDPARSLLSEAFVERPVMVGTEWYDGTHPSPLRYVRTNIAFAEKLWVRSVDTLPRLRLRRAGVAGTARRLRPVAVGHGELFESDPWWRRGSPTRA